MKGLSIVLLLLLIFSCEKSTEPIGGEKAYLETEKEIYTTNDKIKFYLVNNTYVFIYSHPPGDWALNKKINDHWEVVYPLQLPQVVLPPRAWNSGRMPVATHTIRDTGLYKFQMFFSWDKEAKQLEDLGIILSNTFQVKSGT